MPSPTKDFFGQDVQQHFANDYAHASTDYHNHGHDLSAMMHAHSAGSYKAPPVEVDPFYYPVMPQRPPAQTPPKPRKSSRKTDGKQPTFLTKLYQ